MISGGNDDRNEIGYKIREAEAQKVPLMMVVGKREAAEGKVSLRERGRKDLGVMSKEEALNYIHDQIKLPGR